MSAVRVALKCAHCDCSADTFKISMQREDAVTQKRHMFATCTACGGETLLSSLAQDPLPEGAEVFSMGTDGAPGTILVSGLLKVKTNGEWKTVATLTKNADGSTNVGPPPGE